MKKLQQLKQIIHQSDPSILDLVFGCEIIFKQREVRHPATVLYKNTAGNYLVNVFNQTTTINKRIITKILGRQIFIGDVFKAMKENKLRGYYNFVENTIRVVADDSTFFKTVIIDWTPQKPLDQQSPETWEALIKLLK